MKSEITLLKITVTFEFCAIIKQEFEGQEEMVSGDKGSKKID